MNLDEARYRLGRLRKKYLLLRISEILLLSLTVGCIVWGATQLMLAGAYSITLAFAAMAATFAVSYRRYELHRLDEDKILSYINQRYPTLEDSADLLSRDTSAFTSLENLQLQRTLERFKKTYPQIGFPQRIPLFAGVLAISVLAALGASFIRKQIYSADANTSMNEQRKLVSNAKIPASVKSMIINITPPSYTGLPKRVTDDANLTIPEGTLVNWQITFSDSTRAVAMLFPDRKIDLQLNSGQYTATEKFPVSSFYQLQWTSKSGETRSSDYFRVEVIPDRAPDVTITNLEQTVEVTLNDPLRIDLRSTMGDDYGLTDAYIVATVSKGSGESVKFREERLSFTNPATVSGKKLSASRMLDLLKLGLEPGDELYFYAEAIDNKRPSPGRSRTETFFVTLRDTATQQLSVEGGLGVDLMPEYFRSQRQIIIDTEKLLKNRKRISKHEFNSTSNELGYDQKVLRLKYGEFLGEEFETRIGEAENAIAEEEGEGAEDLTKKYAHVHDKENEHNLVPEKKQPGQDHDHHEGEEEPGKEKSLLDEYKHQHDDPEEATFFNQSIRTKLKAALTEMWDAELYLRLYEPEKSLPYQYKALKLLKEVSNDSRIYVHKTGFDPPPLKEEKRLTGDITEVKSTRYRNAEEVKEIFPAMRAALQIVEEKLEGSQNTLTERESITLNEAGRELSAIALERPGQFLETLSIIKRISENEIPPAQMPSALRQIRRSFWQALPDLAVSADQKSKTIHRLDRAFIENLQDLNK